LKVARRLRESDGEVPGTGEELDHMINAVGAVNFVNFGQH